jgi:hypothetical protein
MSGRFDYVKYDEEANEAQAVLKSHFKGVENAVDTYIDPGLRSRIYDKLEEAYMWCGKAIRDDQLNRNELVSINECRDPAPSVPVDDPGTIELRDLRNSRPAALPPSGPGQD